MKSTDQLQGRRDRVTIDLRGIRPQLQAQAAKHGISSAAWIRRAMTAMLDDDSRDPGQIDSIGGACSAQVVKVTLRLPVASAVTLASRARRAEVSQGVYVASLVDGIPAQVPAPDHAPAVAALSASTDRLAALSADLNACLRLLGRVPRSELDPYRASMRSLVDDVRLHLASAAALVSALRAGKGR